MWVRAQKAPKAKVATLYCRTALERATACVPGIATVCCVCVLCAVSVCCVCVLWRCAVSVYCGGVPGIATRLARVCAVCCVLCAVCCVLCAVCCVLCAVCQA